MTERTSLDHMDLAKAPPAVRVTVRPLASPLPIGLLALAVGSLVLAATQLHWIPAAQAHAAALCLLGFVVPLQFTAFVAAVLSRDEGAATGLAVLSGSWLAIGLVTLLSAGGRSAALGVLLCGACGALAVPVVVAAATKPLTSVVIGLLATRFAVTGAYQLGAPAAVNTAAGIIGVIVSALAWYAAAAFAVEDARGHAVLPTFRPAPVTSLGRAGGVGLADEAGVRAAL